MKRRSSVLLTVVALTVSASWMQGCGTAAPPSGGDQNLPNAMAGPFRVLRDGEIPPQQRSAPWAVRLKGVRDPSAIDADNDPATLGVHLFAAVGDASDLQGPTTRIVRFDADDGRSFNARDPDATVLTASEAWEGGVVGAPSLLRAGGRIWMYYHVAGGIALAYSDDFETFEKHAGVVLSPDPASSWENGWIPAEPSVVQVDDGSYRMFYVAGRGIGEARSDDGVEWQRVSGGPALWPVAAPDFPTPDADTVYEPIDDVQVAGPDAVMATTALGRRVLRVYYAGQNRIGLWSLGMAARYGDDGVLERAMSPVLGNSYVPRGPSVVFFSGLALVYFTAGSDQNKVDSALTIAMGVAPATLSLAIVP